MEDLDAQQSHHAQRFMTTSLYALGVRPYTHAVITAVENGTATVHSDDCDCDFAIPCDAIVDAGTAVPLNALAETGITETYVVGDASQPFNIAMAVRAGNDAGRAI